MGKQRYWHFDVSMRAEDCERLKLGKTVTYKLRLSDKKHAVVNLTVQPSFSKVERKEDEQ